MERATRPFQFAIRYIEARDIKYRVHLFSDGVLEPRHAVFRREAARDDRGETLWGRESVSDSPEPEPPFGDALRDGIVTKRIRQRDINVLHVVRLQC